MAIVCPQKKCAFQRFTLCRNPKPPIRLQGSVNVIRWRSWFFRCLDFGVAALCSISSPHCVFVLVACCCGVLVFTTTMSLQRQLFCGFGFGIGCSVSVMSGCWVLLTKRWWTCSRTVDGDGKAEYRPYLFESKRMDQYHQIAPTKRFQWSHFGCSMPPFQSLSKLLDSFHQFPLAFGSYYYGFLCPSMACLISVWLFAISILCLMFPRCFSIISTSA